jgi:hypothetical protein
VIRVEVVTAGRSGFIIAVEGSDSEPGAGYDWDASGTALVVGQAGRRSMDGEPEEWTAWLWPVAGRYTPLGQSAEALHRATPTDLAIALRKRHAAKGAWWQ